MRLCFRLLAVPVGCVLLFVSCQAKPASEVAGSQTVIYLSWDEEGRSQLYEISLGEEQPVQLTWSQRDVLGYAVAPSTRTLAYVVDSDGVGSEIWLAKREAREAELLIKCTTFVCNRPVWHPDNRRLVYERRQLDEGGFARHSQLWWLDAETAETVPVLADQDAISQSASFSADGDWLSYAGTPDEGIFAFHFEDDRKINVASEMGTPAAWRPDGGAFIVRNLQLVVLHGSDDANHQDHTHNFAQAVHLFAVDVPGGTYAPISGEAIVDDSAPVWSPDGQWIAFSRKQPRTSMGGQLWLVRPDGSEAHALTDSPEISHGAPAWSPDGELILFQRFSVSSDEVTTPEIWYLEVATGKMRRIAAPGFQARWQRGT